MPLRKVTSNVAKFTSAVYGGTKEYSKKMKGIDRKAEAAVKAEGSTGSRRYSAHKMNKKRSELKKKAGVSWRNSVRSRL